MERFRGAAHNTCNLKFKVLKLEVVVDKFTDKKGKVKLVK